jgi:hypothetical protein
MENYCQLLSIDNQNMSMFCQWLSMEGAEHYEIGLQIIMKNVVEIVLIISVDLCGICLRFQISTISTQKK